MDRVLAEVTNAVRQYLAGLDTRPARPADPDRAAAHFAGGLPEEGDGASGALAELLRHAPEASISPGPRFFHFVQGGVTPAALGADWLATALDQNAAWWINSPLAAQLERLSLDWLKDLLRLPSQWTGVLTTGATMANFTALAAARQWWGHRHGVDIASRGLAGLPPLPVLSGGYIHPSAVKALAMLGVGTANLHTFRRDNVGRLDLTAMEQALTALQGQPAILVANAGEVNTGDFDPIERLADLAQRYNAWLHVDGAFGLFARVSPRTAQLTAGTERAHSVTADGHKWLNVPYDCGFALVRDAHWLRQVFAQSAAYLPAAADDRPNFALLGPEMSRRARSLAVWATLKAYGRQGYRSMVERHLQLAQHLAQRVDAASDLERLAAVRLNVVCFRYRPPGAAGDALNRLNQRLAEAVLADGRVYVGTTVYAGQVAFRPAIVNWRTGTADVDQLVDVVRELGGELTG